MRTRASVEHGWRCARRIARSWLALGVQGLFLACVLAAVGVPYIFFEDLVLGEWQLSWFETARSLLDGSLNEKTRNPDAVREFGVYAGMFIAGSIAAGVWLRFGLAHWKRVPAHLAWAIALALALILPPTIEDIHRVLTGINTRPVGVLPEERLSRAGAGVISALVAIAGAPVGRILDRTWHRKHARLLAKRRRSLRKLRRPTA